ncbi:chemotaxis response regulator protein-glutamate methylesterase [bacterium]|nr:chemotaxis response regulator protein-glutamate methylesterase [bacterium]
MDTQRIIKVLAIDDSAFMRKTISSILNSAEDIEVVATGRDGYEAVQKVTDYHPDVVTLDIEMPRLNGLDTLGYIMSECPTPVVMLSAYTEEGAEMTIKALEYGAVDFICKPSGPISLDLTKVGEELINKVRAAAQVDISRLKFIEYEKLEKVEMLPETMIAGRQVVVIGSSTGGPRALYEVVPKLPADFPAAVLIVQHMARGFTKSLAERMNRVSNLSVKEAEDGDEVLAGHVYIAPSNFHMVVAGFAGKEVIRLHQGPARNSVRPAADVTMESTAKLYRRNCLGVVLTGMGRDGTQGAAVIHKNGGIVLAEDKSSCVIFGMPKSVIEAGMADKVYPIHTMSDQIKRLVKVNIEHNIRKSSKGRNV